MTSRHFTVETLADGVHTTIASPGGSAICNSAVVDLGDSTLVFDTTLTPRSAEDLAAAALELTGRRPTLAANSHWHMDHMLGNSVFSSLPIYATRRTREILLEKRTQLETELAPESAARELAEVERLGKESGRGVSRELLDLCRAFVEGAPTFQFTPPTRVFEQRFVLPTPRKAELLSWGSGHTDSDAVLHLPEERVVYAGDLVMARNHPSTGSGNVEHWIEVLDEVERLRPERVVPGHGPVSSIEVIEEMREYLRTLLRFAREPGDHPMPAKYASWGFGESFEQSIQLLRARTAPK